MQIPKRREGFRKQSLVQERAFSEKLIRFLRYRQKVKQAHYYIKKKQVKQQEKIRSLERQINHLSKNNDKESTPRANPLQTPQSQYETTAKSPFSQKEIQTGGQNAELLRRSQMQALKKSNPSCQVKEQQEIPKDQLKKERLKRFSDILEKIQNFEKETLRIQTKTLKKEADKQENKKLKQEANTFKKETEALKEENQNFKKETEALKEKNQNFKKETEALKEKNQNFKKETEALKEKNQNFKKETNTLKEENQNFKKETNTLKEENQNFKKQIHTLSKKLIPLLKYRKKIKKIHPDIKRLLQEAKEKETGLHKANEILKKQLQDSKEGVLILQNEREIIKKQGELKTQSHHSKTKKLKNQIESLSGQLKKKTEREKQLKKELQKLEEELKIQQKQKKQFKNELQKLEEELKIQQKQKKQFKNELQKLEEELKIQQKQKKQLKIELKKQKEQKQADIEEGLKRENQITKKLQEMKEKEARLKEEIQAGIKVQNQLKEEAGKGQTLSQRQEKKLKEKEELYNSLREVITQQQEGFTQMIYSSQRKRQEQMKAFKEQKQLLIQNTNDLKNRLKKLQKLNNQKETEIESLTSDYSTQVHSLRQDIKGSKSYSKELEKEIMKLKQSQSATLHEQEKIWEAKAGEEVLKHKKSLQDLKTKSQKETSELKREHKTQMEKLCRSHEKRIRHICTEMENNLLSETKRTEALKAIKNRKITELESNLSAIQQKAYELKTQNLGFEKTRKQEEEALQKEILKNTELKSENKRLKSLWENLQQELEKRNQQVLSLQNLNRDLSLLFNKKKNIQESDLTL